MCMRAGFYKLINFIPIGNLYSLVPVLCKKKKRFISAGMFQSKGY